MGSTLPCIDVEQDNLIEKPPPFPVRKYRVPRFDIPKQLTQKAPAYIAREYWLRVAANIKYKVVQVYLAFGETFVVMLSQCRKGPDQHATLHHYSARGQWVRLLADNIAKEFWMLRDDEVITYSPSAEHIILVSLRYKCANYIRPKDKAKESEKPFRLFVFPETRLICRVSINREVIFTYFQYRKLVLNYSEFVYRQSNFLLKQTYVTKRYKSATAERDWGKCWDLLRQIDNHSRIAYINNEKLVIFGINKSGLCEVKNIIDQKDAPYQFPQWNSLGKHKQFNQLIKYEQPQQSMEVSQGHKRYRIEYNQIGWTRSAIQEQITVFIDDKEQTGLKCFVRMRVICLGLRLKEVYMFWLQNMNKDFEDDLLRETIELLTQ